MEKEIEKKEIVKPSLDLELKVEVNGIAKIENNMSELKELALKFQDYYTNIKFIEDETKLNFEDKEQMTLIENKKKEAREEKAKINNFKKVINDKSKVVLEKYNEPINKFLELKKETIDILTKTYDTINSQVEIVDTQLLDEKRKRLENYFNELAEKETIDFTTYEAMKQNVTLSASIKSLKKEINNFINKIKDELKLIETQEHKVEILVEYKKSLNVANAITNVNERFKEIELVKAREEARKLKLEQEEEQIKKVEEILKKAEPVVEKIVPIIEETPLMKPIEETNSTIEFADDEINEEKLLTAEFKVTATKEKLESLIEFLDNGGYVYE